MGVPHRRWPRRPCLDYPACLPSGFVAVRATERRCRRRNATDVTWAHSNRDNANAPTLRPKMAGERFSGRCGPSIPVGRARRGTATVITLVERACPSRGSDAAHAPPGTRAVKLNVGSEEKCLRELGPTRLAGIVASLIGAVVKLSVTRIATGPGVNTMGLACNDCICTRGYRGALFVNWQTAHDTWGERTEDARWQRARSVAPSVMS
jgi:hypothetical protein